MLSVFNAVNLRVALLRINIVNTWQQETAFFGDSWGNVASTVVYTMTFLIFIQVIFANVQSIAGYSRNQMLFLLFINQINFYITYGWSYNNMLKLVNDVNRGAFDLTLIKPLPALWYSSTRMLSVLSIVRDGTVPFIIYASIISWSALHLSLWAVLAGIVVACLGQLALNAFFFFLVAPVFWVGQSSDLITVGYGLTSIDVPYEGVVQPVRLGLTTLVPCLLPTALATSVMLGKVAILPGLAIAIAVTVALVWAKLKLWQAALNNYTSASS